jgi:hypothetical protein
MISAARQFLHDWATYRRNKVLLNDLDEHLASQAGTVIVHQIGRAGSMTIVNTIRGAELNEPVFHTHALNPIKVERRMRRFQSWPIYKTPLNVRVAKKISDYISHNGLGDRQWHLVTVFRDPIGRNLSVFFLSIEDFIHDFFRRYHRGDLSKDEILDVFVNRFAHQQPLSWFDEEIRDVFEIDVYEYPFPMGEGFQIIRQGKVNLLLIKLESLDECYQIAFDRFFGRSIKGLRNTHITDKDPSYSMYSDFIKTATFPEAFLDEMYDSRFVRHFYSDAEIARFRKRWGNGKLAQAADSPTITGM